FPQVRFFSREKLLTEAGTSRYGVRRKENFPDQGCGKTSREAVELRTRAAQCGDRRVQHRAGILDISARLQIDIAERRIEADQAGASGVHGDQREFDER